ncbi:MAG: phenylalanine--tRNA ligase subunit beta, partial [Prolixibacteraceae bacterium]|nr:phenylalanine--tRNA ligase subunit beta [Prolixibacteraceae bacterium]
MKISVNWLKEYTKIDLPIDKLVEKIGAQLGAVEEIVDLGAKYKGALIVKVTSCVQHPNADKLHVCMIDDGKVTKDVPRAENGQIQVVCGANNVAEGQTVIWLPPGAVVPETYGTNEPFELTAKELRGILSQGMIASARELDFGDDHAGIIVLDQDVEPGTPITKTFWLDDYIIDIENKMFTHRPDCFGILGVAREVAGIQNTDFKSPDWYLTESSEQVNSSSNNLPLIIENNVPSIAPRFMAIVMSDIEIAKSPFWLQTFLARLGVKPINNVVDVTNFVMLLTGQPLHAYDYDKVAKTNSDGAARIIVRKANDKEELILLGNKSIELDSKVDSAIIATDKMAIGLGGLMGGADTEVDDETKNIILECANFDMFAIRKTAMKYGIFTDAFTRFSKNQSKFQNDRVITKAAEMIKENANGVLASKTMDTPNVKYVKQFVKTTAQFINKRLGLSLSVYEIAKLLKNVEFEVTVNQDSLDISAPFWRTDIEIAEDIVEEVGRLYGFGKLPVELPHRTLKPAKKDELFKLKGQIRQNLASAGANELLTYSFVHGKLIDKAGQNRDLAFQL